jgi:hypothetical protein
MGNNSERGVTGMGVLIFLGIVVLIFVILSFLGFDFDFKIS